MRSVVIFGLLLIAALQVSLGCSQASLPKEDYSHRKDIIAPIRLDEKWGAIDTHGKVLVEAAYDSVSHGFQAPSLLGANASVAQQGVLLIGEEEWRYVNAKDSHSFRPLLSDVWRATNLGESLFAIEIDPKKRSKEFSGSMPSRVSLVPSVVFDPYDQWNPPAGTVPHDRIAEGLLTISQNGKLGFADRTGTIEITPKYDAAYPFREGLAAIKLDGKWGYIDKTGEIVISPQFKHVHSFDNEIALVSLPDQEERFFIDKKGDTVAKWPFTAVSFASEGLIRLYDTQTELYGYAEFNGEWQIAPQFKDAAIFTEGFAFVRTDPPEKSGFIDHAGKFIAEFSHLECLTFFTNGMAWIEVDKDAGLFGYIGTDGRWIWKPNLKSASNADLAVRGQNNDANRWQAASFAENR